MDIYQVHEPDYSWIVRMFIFRISKFLYNLLTQIGKIQYRTQGLLIIS